MSSPFAIAGVTAVLKDLLNNGVVDHDLGGAVGGSVVVTALPPDKIETGPQEKDQLNLFLYQVTPNQGWRNAGLPSRDAAGVGVGNPPLALDLHYLLTAYGNKEMNAEVLLGYAMHLLHERPVLRRDDIRTCLAAPVPVNSSLLPPAFQNRAAADLADQVELLKITPQGLTNDELSKLWTAFQGRYRMGAGYVVSVVLIDATGPTRAAVPVRSRGVFVLPVQPAAIYGVSPPVVATGEQLTLRGQNLQAPGLQVSFGAARADPALATAERIVVVVPDGLKAGVNTVQLVRDLDFGTPDEPHGGFTSNVAPFVLAPRITTPVPMAGVYAATRGADFTLDVDPPVEPWQDARLIVGARSLLVPPRASPTAEGRITVRIPTDFPKGVFLLRVEVDGAQSVQDVDATDPQNPTIRGPRVDVQ